MQVNRTIPSTKPDIIIMIIKKERVLTYVAISGERERERNVIKREAEKILKYKDCTTENEHMWTVNTKAIPVITGATGTVSKSLSRYPSNISGKRENYGAAENSHIGHHTLQDVLK